MNEDTNKNENWQKEAFESLEDTGEDLETTIRRDLIEIRTMIKEIKESIRQIITDKE